MIFKEINLGIGNAKLTVYRPDRIGERGEAMLVIPGGGYGGLSSSTEGEPIALAFASRGFVAFVLSYSTGAQLPENCPLAEASAGLAYIRRNAPEYGIATDRIYACGFSAGGHLCGSLATLWHKEEICRLADVVAGENRPDAVALSYPVISTDPNFGHLPSFYNLFGTKNPTKEQTEYYSLEKQVDEKSSPAFIIHTAEDEIVPVMNSVVMAQGYIKAGVKFELHIYPDGPHGRSLGNDITRYKKDPAFIDEKYARWVDDCIYFFRKIYK